MARTTRPNARMIHGAERINRAAPRLSHALELLGQVRTAALDGTQGEQVHTSQISRPTEAQALARYEASTMIEELRDHLDDWINTTDLFVAHIEDAVAWSHRRLGTTPAPLAVVVMCTGEGYEGRELPWRPHDSDPRNGWHDPVCRDIADVRNGQQLKVCPRCLRRLEAWRARNGLPPLATVPAKVVA